ncbi:hypothetical protein [Streptomyces sp. NPDC048650]|uniref:hypothetical protein n=1 Tax=unclassified Streptomyces TaxID=2593676 RepID=UPI00372002D2
MSDSATVPPPERPGSQAHPRFAEAVRTAAGTPRTALPLDPASPVVCSRGRAVDVRERTA